ncbi:hypothetical protein BGZ97_002742 [Linnemannia gamsii]|uniref:Uncharacterized protein n=1 Tax=Linnemannia gamsii TaxID=64522 RepID=A0A9P6UIA6_9FUNG|nr:hypothetical protein BGZ97_002742 [Linnemannia gamsii]
MGSKVSSHSKGNLDVTVSPVSVQVVLSGVDIAFRIDQKEQLCPYCNKAEGLSYTKEEDGTYVFTCSLCNKTQRRK